MKYIIATIACLAITSAIAAGATRTTTTTITPEPGTEQELICRGDIVCVDHREWCEPKCPVGCGEPTLIGSC